MNIKNINLRVKTGDSVILTCGNDKGKVGEILKVDKKNMRVVVKGVNIKKKHQKPTNDTQGGIVEMEKSVHISNVAHVLDGKAAKVTYSIKDDKKVLVFKKSEKEVRS
ncbi:50S ribosomal protein L24 [Candidatus Cytomitobacter primus]|uniref:Large ribosomal subunit protein uL24 n=1 Tax=Candidatus Cytomitobacter primus TaxID=2066024 RepID=A0A5C0UG77_9PROT|nr:50S ribosomal protein L24 [Candidatus Cytomitobacter primus]QEK38730.1 50S ribosomal protein L24 [Candidatus Cytomitobacter primus]